MSGFIAGVPSIELFIAFSVTALHLAVMSRCVRADKFVLDVKFSGSVFKERGQILLAVGKTVCKFKSIVGLDTLHSDLSA